MYPRTYRPLAAALVAFALLARPAAARAQTPPSPPPSAPQEPAMPEMMDHSHMHMDMPGWHFMQDGAVSGLFNHQGGARGDDEVKAPNWWMGMWTRASGRHALTLTSMFSLDRATMGRTGYAELFQANETVGGKPIVDRQHPHDFFMQLAGAWRVSLGDTTSLTIAGGPAGEAALGPVAFMHRASAAENPTAPLGHHTFDSTHVSYGVVTTRLDRGRWTLEASAFNGREPDENRWDLDLGPLDSVSGRLSFRPSERWEWQASVGRLTDPEPLSPGDIVRTTTSASWLARDEGGRDFVAVTVGAGANRHDGETLVNVFAESTWRTRAVALYGRVEVHQPEIALLVAGQTGSGSQSGGHDTLGALTLGGVHDLLAVHGFDLAVGGDVTGYAVPTVLRAAGYGRPVSMHVFLRLRPRAAGGRMWNMQMGRP